jgi:8-oxo-dGTP diphosphatase
VLLLPWTTKLVLSTRVEFNISMSTTEANLSHGQPLPPATSMKTQQHVRVGVGVLVKDTTRPNAIYAGIRKGSHGAGCLALPGGHLEMFETWEECAIREVKEEMNLDLDCSSVQLAHVTNDMMKSEEKHYVTIFMMTTTTTTCQGKGRDTTVQVPQNMEPHKCEGWKSYTWQELKDIHVKGVPTLFGPLSRLLEEAPASVQKFLAE